MGESRGARRSVLAVLLVGAVLASIVVANAEVAPPVHGGYAYEAAGAAAEAGGGGPRSIEPGSGPDVALVVLQLGLLLVVARALGEAGARMNLPSVVGAPTLRRSVDASRFRLPPGPG
jgi:hypothetical protein